nr:hypothetical protein [Staphylococcus lutrae]
MSEIVHPNDFELADQYLDVFQIGARNMQNFELLKEAGRTRKPILLKRAFLLQLKNLYMQQNTLLLKGIKISFYVSAVFGLMKKPHVTHLIFPQSLF